MRYLRFASLVCLLSAAALVSGCGGQSASSSAALTGNWAFTPAATGAKAPFTINVGFAAPAGAGASSASAQYSGIARMAGAGCLAPTANIALTGTADSHGALTLTSQPFSGTTLTLRGQLSPDGNSLTGASYAFSGGACATLASGALTATHYTSISGTYSGTFTDTEGNQIPVTATLTQTSQPDGNGQFHLSGSATFANNPCFTSPILTDSLVTGSSLSTTYSSTVNGQTSTITATGTFNSDATQLTVSNWTVSGGNCNGQTGTGALAEQP